MKLLIVDDEFFAVSGVMEGVNWDVLKFKEVFKAYSYGQAVEIMQKTFIDLLLCDIEMPDESGLELVSWVHEHSPNTECIMLTCHDEFDYARQALLLQCLDYVLKPVRYEELTAILKKAQETVAKKHHQAVMENYGKKYLEHFVVSDEGKTTDAVTAAVDYIETHLGESLSVKQLASLTYVSADHLTRMFKKKYNQTVSEYISEKRMLLAGELLKQNRLTITMVSDSVGFVNYSYFTEQFKKYYGMTPREYQREHRGE